MGYAEKILTRTELEHRLSRWSKENKTIVFTNGCFDILHKGHIVYLEQARQLGDVLLVGLNSDESVRRLKGEDRPFNKEGDRAVVLAGLGSVDGVILFEEDTPLNLILSVKPDVLVKGGDYRVEDIVGASEVKEHGGKVMTLDFVAGFSSSEIIDKIQKD